MGFISAIWGIVALIAMCVAFIPLLGILNWFVIPFSAIGVVLGFLSLNGPGRAGAKTGLVCSVVALILSFVRLSIGGGII
ncbi:MAG: hypothetical protein V5B78_07085 [Desulfohalobiaceae bacterium]